MAGLWCGVWLGSDLVTGLFGWLGLVWPVAEFGLGAMWSGYGGVMWLVMDYRVCIRCEAVGV